MQGVVYFCIRVKDKENTFEVHAEVAGMNRHEIKQMYTDMAVSYTHLSCIQF